MAPDVKLATTACLILAPTTDFVLKQPPVTFARAVIPTVGPTVNKVRRHLRTRRLLKRHLSVSLVVQTTVATTLATRAPCGNACACLVNPCPSAVVTNPCTPNPWFVADGRSEEGRSLCCVQSEHGWMRCADEHGSMLLREQLLWILLSIR